MARIQLSKFQLWFQFLENLLKLFFIREKKCLTSDPDDTAETAAELGPVRIKTLGSVSDVCIYGSQKDSAVTHLLPENEHIQLTSHPIILSWVRTPVIGWLTSGRGSGWQFILGAMQFTLGVSGPLCRNLVETAGTSLTLHWAAGHTPIIHYTPPTATSTRGKLEEQG